jgi:serine/threonine protein kinase/tetratricopeptide (TPR) repeat protein
MEAQLKTAYSELALGQTFRTYRIDAQLGSGGMGVVYRAYDFRLGRPVALKVLSRAFREDPEAQTILFCEARIAATLSHPNICVIYEAGEQDGCTFISMECVEGRSLAQMLRPAGLSFRAVAEYGAQIAQALHYAHTHGVVHRDVKCANVIINEDGRAKVLDFGLADLALSRKIAEVATSHSSLTELGPIAGTLPYVAPEVLHGKAATSRSDIWSLGVVLYEMATGRLPFQGNTAFEVSMGIMMGVGPEMDAVPPGIRQVVARCLDKDPAQRYQSAQDVSTDLLGAIESSSARRIKALRTRAFLVAGALMLLVSLATGMPWLRTHLIRRASTPRENRSIVLAQFSNHTGDPVFDDVLNQALDVALKQSPFLKIMPSSQVHQTLVYLGKPPTATLTLEVARSVCARAGASAVVQGSIAQVGASYVIGITASDCHTSDVLAEVQRSTSGGEGVFDALDQSASEVRKELGESLRSIRQYDVPIVRATTSSLAAFQSFTLGVKAAEGSSGYAGAIAFFRRAIELDPEFATAYEGLGVAYADLGEMELARENLRKAYDLRSRVSEPERLQIEAHYYDLVTGNLLKAREVYQVWTGVYPENAMAHGNLGECYALQGQYEQAVDETLTARRIDPSHMTRTCNLITFYLALGRVQEARSAFDQAIRQDSENPDLHILGYELAFLEQDSSGRDKEVAWAQNKPGIEDVLLAYEADTQAYYGHLSMARELSRRAVRSAQRSGQNDSAAAWQGEAALREALFGNLPEARSAAVTTLPQNRDVSAASALALALADDRRASSMANELARRFPEDTVVNMSYLPAIRGAIALKEGRPQDTIVLLRDATPYEMGAPTTSYIQLALYPVYVRGLAYLALGRGSEAAHEFQKILGHPGLVLNEPIGALSQFQHARACAFNGDVTGAHSSYQAFRALWSSPDGHIPILKQALGMFRPSSSISAPPN